MAIQPWWETDTGINDKLFGDVWGMYQNGIYSPGVNDPVAARQGRNDAFTVAQPTRVSGQQPNTSYIYTPFGGSDPYVRPQMPAQAQPQQPQAPSPLPGRGIRPSPFGVMPMQRRQSPPTIRQGGLSGGLRLGGRVGSVYLPPGTSARITGSKKTIMGGQGAKRDIFGNIAYDPNAGTASAASPVQRIGQKPSIGPFHMSGPNLPTSNMSAKMAPQRAAQQKQQQPQRTQTPKTLAELRQLYKSQFNMTDAEIDQAFAQAGI